MSLVDGGVMALHLLFAAVWVGSVVFVTLAVLPLARAGDADAAPLERLVDRLSTVSRTSAVVMLLTGGHAAGSWYTVESLTGTGRGHLVLAMVALWLVLAALVEVGAARLRAGFEEKRVRAPARANRKWFLAASVVGVALFVDAGLLATGGL